LVHKDALGPYLLIGRQSEEEIFIWSAWQVKPSFQWDAFVTLPRGLSVLGRFGEKKADENNALQGGVGAEERFVATLKGQELNEWKVAQPSDILIRSSLELHLDLKQKELSKALGAMVAQMEDLHFAFPQNESQLPTLSQLRTGAAKLGPIGPMASGEEVVIQTFSEELGTSGRSNFVDLDFKGTEKVLNRVDLVAYVPKDSTAVTMAEELVEAAKHLFAQLEVQVSTSKLQHFSVRCYRPQLLGHAISLRGTENQQLRQELHHLFRFPDEPLLVPQAAMPPPGQVSPCGTGKPVNPHNDCGLQPSWWKGGDSTKRAFVRGLYEYNHYMQDGFDDNGWGCAYRSLQTCVSWYRLQHYSEELVPSIPEIQRLLKRIDEAHKDLEIGSKKWIGTVEGMYLLQEYLKVDCKMLFCQNCDDMASQAPQMLQHLNEQGTPIMMGAGNYAYTLVGLCFDSTSGEVAYLIVDPHYTGKDELKPILSKGWVGWKNLDFFEKSTEGSFINCCLPLVPRGAEYM